MFMINCVDPEEITSRHHEIINGLKGIRRGKIFSDFNDIKTFVKKIIKREVIEQPKNLISHIKEIECLFKKM